MARPRFESVETHLDVARPSEGGGRGGATVTPLNGCGVCGADFTSLRSFDAHRVGVHEYLASPERPDGRRCLTPDELRVAGYEQDARGRWFDPVRREETRRRFL